MSEIYVRLASDLRARRTDARAEQRIRAAYAAHAAMRAKGQTGAPYDLYRDAYCDQVAASWVLGAVFIRVLEDRGYLPPRLARLDTEDGFSHSHEVIQFVSARAHLLQAFDALAAMPGGREIFGRSHTPLWRLSPTSGAVSDLLEVLRTTDNDSLRFTFGRLLDGGSSANSTAYLGDLYQALDPRTTAHHGLVQTPDFVAQLLLDDTLDAALDERGSGVVVLDPACGSGTLLLNAYERLCEARLREEPTRPLEEVARTALGQIYGIDLVSYAAAITRFRLFLSYLEHAALPTMAGVPADFRIMVRAGDSLLAGLGIQQPRTTQQAPDLREEPSHPQSDYLFDDPEVNSLLGNKRFDVVVATPPYVTEKDEAKRALLHKHYESASGKFPLAVPFTERAFRLGNEGAYIGLLTSNSFMKREFGRRLVEHVLPKWDLTALLDTSGAYIPGFGTPTIILFGRAQTPQTSLIRVLLCSRVETVLPAIPAQGRVWSAIAAHRHHIGYTDEQISMVSLERHRLARHPWVFFSGGAAVLKEKLEAHTSRRLGTVVDTIGVEAVLSATSLFVIPLDCARRWRVPTRYVRPYASGESLRDWTSENSRDIIFPFSEVGSVSFKELGNFGRILWSHRTTLSKARRLHAEPWRGEEGRLGEYTVLRRTHHIAPYRIAFPAVATHNHFILDTRGSVFGQTAPVLQLPIQASLNDYLALLAYLNSSTFCFWAKMVAQDKPRGDLSLMDEEWAMTFEFSPSSFSKAPVPDAAISAGSTLVPLARELVALGQDWSLRRPSARTLDGILDSDPENLRHRMAEAITRFLQIEGQIRALQEQLDWAVYAAFKLCPPELAEHDVVTRNPGERVCDLLYARKTLEQGSSRRYFEVHGMPNPHLVATQVLNELDERRLKAIASNPWLKILEQPSYKRRYGGILRHQDASSLITGACESWILECLEAELQEPRAMSVRMLADILYKNSKFRAITALHAGDATLDRINSMLGELLRKEAVPAAKCQRYTSAGCEKRALWEKIWDIQRHEDAGADITAVPDMIPPTYDREDFADPATVWPLRGKLDIPTERFISYPHVGPPNASGAMETFYGWGGWDHLEQMQAAIDLYSRQVNSNVTSGLPQSNMFDKTHRSDDDVRHRLLPLLQTIADLVPWVKQWHASEGRLTSNVDAFLSIEADRLQVTSADIRSYRIPSRLTGRSRIVAAENRKIPLLKIELSIRELHRDRAAGKLDLLRRFRCAIIWSPMARAQLIESVLLRFPLSPFYLAEMRGGMMRIIDGLQRLSALFDFIEDRFVLADLHLLPEFTGLRFSDLPSKLQRRFEDTALTLMVLNSEADPRLVTEVFDRTNAWAPLSEIERGE